MPTLRKPQLRKLSAGAALAAALTPPPHAAAALLVHEPFDYPAVSTPLLDGTVATGLNLTGTYVSDVVHPRSPEIRRARGPSLMRSFHHQTEGAMSIRRMEHSRFEQVWQI